MAVNKVVEVVEQLRGRTIYIHVYIYIYVVVGPERPGTGLLSSSAFRGDPGCGCRFSKVYIYTYICIYMYIYIYIHIHTCIYV